MDTEQINEQIDELKDSLNKEVESRKKLEKELSEIKELLSVHNHTNHDGTKRLTSTIEIANGEYLGIGDVAGMLSKYLPATNQDQFAMIIGKDRDDSNGSSNAQIFVQHYNNTDQTFFEGTRAPQLLGYDGELKINSTIKTGTFKFETNELAGAYIDIRIAPTSTTPIGIFLITSNTADTITFTGTISSDVNNTYFYIFMPVLLGSGSIPWRKGYFMEGSGTTGGIRFGFGVSGDGNNGLLYMDSVGDLYWRDKTKTASEAGVKLN